MMNRINAFLTLSLGILLAACAPTVQETTPIRIGVLPVLDTLPSM